MRARCRVALYIFWIFTTLVGYGPPIAHAEDSPQIQVEALFPEERNSDDHLQREEADALESAYRRIDYGHLPVTPDGYVEALRLAEQGDALAAIYRYSRYSDALLQRHAEAKSALVALPKGRLFSTGLIRQRIDAEAELHLAVDRNGQDRARAIELHQWRKNVWAIRLANYARALVAIDEYLLEPLADEAKEILQNQRLTLLAEEPILGMVAPSPFDEGDRRPLYRFVHDIFFHIPSSNILCRTSTSDCPLLKAVGWGRPQIEILRRHLSAESEEVKAIGIEAIENLRRTQKANLAHGKDEVAVEALTWITDRFPGGSTRYQALIRQNQESSLEERLELRIRQELAYAIAGPLLRKMITSLRKDLETVGDRTFSDYLDLKPFRHRVRLSFPEKFRSLLEGYDEDLVRRARFTRRLRKRADVAFYLLIGASLSIVEPPAGLLMFTSPAVWARLLATGAHAYSLVQTAGRHQAITSARTLRGFTSYEALALAQSQFRRSYLEAFFEIFLPMRLGPIIKPSLARFGRSLAEFGTNPLGRFQVLRIAVGNARPRYLVTGALSSGLSFTKKLATSTAEGLWELGELAGLGAKAGGATLRGTAALLRTEGPAAAESFLAARQALQKLLSQVVVSRTGVGNGILNGAVSSGIMVFTERISRGPDFWKEPGASTNLLITLLDDGALGFYGLGNFTAVERLVAIGGITFTMSILGQWITDCQGRDRLLERAGSESAYVLSFSLWKAQIANEGVVRLVNALPSHAIARHSAYWGVFGLNNGFGNLLYSLGTKNMFEHDSPIRQTPWWPQASGRKPNSSPRVVSTQTRSAATTGGPVTGVSNW